MSDTDDAKAWNHASWRVKRLHKQAAAALRMYTEAEVRERERKAFVAGAHWAAWAGSGEAEAEALRRYKEA